MGRRQRERLFEPLYTNGGTTKFDLDVAIPGGVPTGVVFNGVGGSSFVITDGFDSRPAVFIFASEGGDHQRLEPSGRADDAVANRVHRGDGEQGAMYTGLALEVERRVSSFLYAADFHNARVDVFDDQFRLTTLAGSFSDPALPAGYAPFGIHTIGGRVFVTYAKQDADAEDPVAGNGLGFVNMFDANGNLIARVAGRGQLNAPWGIAVSPTDFGRASGRYLVANFGDGKITAYEEVSSGVFEADAQLRGARGGPLSIDGLRALGFETASRPARRTRSSLRPAPTPELTDSSVR